MTTRFIGLGGHLAAGKDAVADHLVAQYDFTKIGMSDVLLECALELDPWIPTSVKDWAYSTPGASYDVRLSYLVQHAGYVKAKENPEVRRFLQKLGTEVGRNRIGENVWVDMVAAKVRVLAALGHDVVLTGIRFPNELQMVRDLGGLAVYILRPGHEPAAGIGTHASENGVNRQDFDRVILNAGSLDNLYATTDRILGERFKA